ncbi:MAG: sulfate/thiosulfate transport system permease protein, partial [Ilumatobacteraceae bacterium]
MHSHAATVATAAKPGSKYLMRIIGLGYLAVLVGVPVGLIFWRTFENGISPVLDSLSDPSVLHAFR